MSVRALMGAETEYALTAREADGKPFDRGALMELLFQEARTAYPHLRDAGSGLFLANGARLYLDRGYHPEFATPECGDPWEVVRYIRAGETILLGLAERVKALHPAIREIAVFRSNVDYDRGGTTWGCHESYLHDMPPRALPPLLLPHFVSRIIYAGAGGFNPLIPGAEFTLSPRAWLLSHATAADSTGERGIFHFRDEPLATGAWERLHVICGESLCSDTAAVLKIGTTALALAAIRAGRNCGLSVRLANPVQALRRIAAEPAASVPLENGRSLTALAIQRHYLAEVEACRPRDLPEWAPELCRLWRTQLDLIERSAASVERTVDWAIKRALFRRWIAGTMNREVFRCASSLLERIERISERRFRADGQVTLSVPALLGNGQCEAEQRERLTPLLTAEGLTWDDIRRFLALRAELFEIDFRFGQLGDGIFEQLEGRGLLTHRQKRCGSVSGAVHQPPAGRAAIRGHWVTQLWKQNRAREYRSDWVLIWNEITGRRLDLSDPFVRSAQWQ